MTPTTTSRPRALLRAAVAAIGVWLAAAAALNLFIVGRAATDENLFIDPLSRLYVVEHVDGQLGTPRSLGPHAPFVPRQADAGDAIAPGDVLIAGWVGTVTLDESLDVFAAAERVWVRHNRDDRPDGQLCPSMSVGDVVVIGETALTVESCGFSVCSVDASDVIADRTWRQWIASADAQHLTR